MENKNKLIQGQNIGSFKRKGKSGFNILSVHSFITQTDNYLELTIFYVLVAHK